MQSKSRQGQGLGRSSNGKLTSQKSRHQSPHQQNKSNSSHDVHQAFYDPDESILTQCSHATHRPPTNRDHIKRRFNISVTSIQSTDYANTTLGEISQLTEGFDDSMCATDVEDNGKQKLNVTFTENKTRRNEAVRSMSTPKSSRKKKRKSAKPPTVKVPEREKSKPVTELFDWIIRPVPDVKGVCVEGQKKGKTDFWHSSAITDIRKRKLVKTATGTVYRLRGKLNKLCTLETGFSQSVAKEFKNGFPSNWKKILQKFYSTLENSISIEEECSTVHGYSLNKTRAVHVKKSANKKSVQSKEVLENLDSIVTPFGLVKRCNSAHNFTTTRSGRLSLPPLAQWQGQRYIISTKSNTLSIGCQTSVAERALLKDTKDFMKMPKVFQKQLYHKSLSKSILECSMNNTSNNNTPPHKTVISKTPINKSNNGSEKKQQWKPNTNNKSDSNAKSAQQSNVSKNNEKKKSPLVTNTKTGEVVDKQKEESNSNANNKMESTAKSAQKYVVLNNTKKKTSPTVNGAKVGEVLEKQTKNICPANSSNISAVKKNVLEATVMRKSIRIQLTDCHKENRKTRSAQKKNIANQDSDTLKQCNDRNQKGHKNCSVDHPSTSSYIMNRLNGCDDLNTTVDISSTTDNVLDCSIVLRNRTVIRYDISDDYSKESDQDVQQSHKSDRGRRKSRESNSSSENESNSKHYKNSRVQKTRSKRETSKGKQHAGQKKEVDSNSKCQTTTKSVSCISKQAHKSHRKSHNKRSVSISVNENLKGVECKQEDRPQRRGLKRKCESPVSDDTGYCTEEQSCVREQQDSTPKSCGKKQVRKRRKLSLPTVSEAAGNKEMWTEKEKSLFERALRTVDVNSPTFWGQMSSVVESKTESECREFHTNYLEQKTKTAPERKKVARKPSARQKGEPIRGGKGTLKRKQDLRDFLQEQNDDYEDNPFDATPFASRKAAVPMITNIDFDKDDSEIFGSNHNFITPMTKNTAMTTPSTRLRAQLASTKKTPVNVPIHHSVNDTPNTLVRHIADKYIHTFKNQHKPTICQNHDDVSSTVECSSKADKTLPIKSLFSPSIVVYDKERQIEEEEDESNPFIYYWNEEEN